MKPNLLMALALGGALWAQSVDQLAAASPDAKDGVTTPAAKYSKAVAAKHAYERAMRNARIQYIRQLDIAIKEVMKADDLEEANKIDAIKQRIIAEHLKAKDSFTTVFKMSGMKLWEESAISVRKGEAIEVHAPDADINKLKVKATHGISAPVGSLLMRIDGKIYDIGKHNTIVAEGDGTLFFRSNLKVSPNHVIDISVSIR